MFKIGNVEIKNNVCLAPMAGVCDSAFRTIIKSFGCGLIEAEMVSDKAIMYEDKKTFSMLKMSEEERPIAQQIFGSDKESFVIAAKKVYEIMKPDIIDINMGCPVPKVALRAQAGSALLKDVNKVFDIVKAVVNSVSVPVTVKIRSGWDKDSINAVEVAKACEKAGAAAITIHPRTRSQGYSGKADWNIIKSVKENVNIPVIGNGDVKTPEDVKKMLDTTNCDAVMIGRGLIGNPWLIKNSLLYLSGKDMIDVSSKDRIDMILHHIDLLKEFKSDKVIALEIRNHIAYYLKGVVNSKEFKNKIFKINDLDEIIRLLKEYREEL